MSPTAARGTVGSIVGGGYAVYQTILNGGKGTVSSLDNGTQKISSGGLGSALGTLGGTQQIVERRYGLGGESNI